MSQRVYYEIDGRIHGPISLTQLQLMAASGMLQPHHRIRREDTDQWFVAQTVRGLFADPPTSGGVAAPQPAVMSADENPFGGVIEEPRETRGINAAFDFFSEPEPAPAAPPPEKPSKGAKPNKPAKPAAPEPLPFEPVASAPPTNLPAEPPTAPSENPFEFAAARAAASLGAPQRIDEVEDLPEAEALPEEPPAAPPPIMPPPKPGKLVEPQVDPKQPAKIEATTASPSPAEVTGRAVELFPDESIRLMDGKTSFRLHRAWMIVSSKFADGSARTTYIRLQRIDAGILDQRSSQTRSKNDAHSLLAFIAGEVRVGLVFQGNDKPYRAFLEKALLMSNTTSSASRPAGKA